MSTSDEPLPFLQGKFPELEKMSKEQIETEIQAWRNLWGYVPSEVKEYIATMETTPIFPQQVLSRSTNSSLILHQILFA